MLFLASALAAPTVMAPVDGAIVASHEVQLVVRDEGSPVSFEATSSTQVHQVAEVLGDGVRVTWTLPEELVEDTWTCWSAWTDEADPVEACFFVTTTNDPPSNPVLALDPLRVTPGVDAEEREVSTTVRIEHQGLTEELEHSGPDTLELTPPGEAYVVWARTSDGSRVSEWVSLEVAPTEAVDTGQPQDSAPPEDTGEPDLEPEPDPQGEDEELARGAYGGGYMGSCSTAPVAPLLLAWLGVVLLRRRDP